MNIQKKINKCECLINGKPVPISLFTNIFITTNINSNCISCNRKAQYINTSNNNLYCWIHCQDLS